MAKDLIHDIVREALEKDSWVITHDPLILFPNEGKIAIDLGVEKIIIAERNAQKIAVEIKSFTQPSIIYSFHEALGQYFNYLTALDEANEERELFLAVSEDVYASFGDNLVIRKSIERYNVKIILFDLENKEIVKWIK